MQVRQAVAAEADKEPDLAERSAAVVAGAAATDLVVEVQLVVLAQAVVQLQVQAELQEQVQVGAQLLKLVELQEQAVVLVQAEQCFLPEGCCSVLLP